ncbi:MAG: hypothetical protein CFE43_21270 [Burkholderiales bacterium PBB3]|nr:MAG: hypothetical protein CFE43_21270 [Burkholderiales bacterium PBB3]
MRNRAQGGVMWRQLWWPALPEIGAQPVREVTEHDLRALLRQMVKRGVHRQTVRTYNDIVQMFAWAEKRKPWRGLMTNHYGLPVVIDLLLER